jgi:hypothetical protein
MLDSLNRVSDMGGLVNNPDHLSLFTRVQLLKTPFPFGEIPQIGPEVGLTDEVAPELKKMPSLPNGDVVLTGNENTVGVIRNIYALCEFIVLVNCLTHLCHETVFRINKMNISNIKRERERKKKKQKERKREREAVEQK